jgi:hypothetical protein
MLLPLGSGEDPVKAARILRNVALTSALGILASGLVNCADEPKPYCLVSPLNFSVKLIEKDRQESVPGACDAFGPASFNANAVVGLVPFYPQDSKGNSDYLNGSVGIQTAEVGTVFFTARDAGIDNTAKDGQVYSFGKFASGRTDDNDLCHVPTLSPTHVVVAAVPDTPNDPTTPDVDESAPGQPAADITLVWSNIDIYVSPANYGTQFQADLLDTRVNDAGEKCSITYKAVGLSPAVLCIITDADGNPVLNDDGSKQFDPTLCDPIANPANGHESGSGITVNTDYECNLTTTYCAIKGDSIPAIK